MTDRRTTRTRTQLGRAADDNTSGNFSVDTTNGFVRERTLIVFLCLNRYCSPPDFSGPAFFFFWRELLVATDQCRIQAEMQQEHSALLAAGGGCWNETCATRSQSLGPGSSGKQHSVKFREFLRLLLQLRLSFQLSERSLERRIG